VVVTRSSVNACVVDSGTLLVAALGMIVSVREKLCDVSIVVISEFALESV
jgi:hypothetical protein